jgi:hypothetical protein
VSPLPTEPFLSQASPETDGHPARGETCSACGAPLASDQRYCLECGERRTQMSSVLRNGPPTPAGPAAGPPTPPVPAGQSREAGWSRNGMLNVIAGVGVLLLAMGVGVLIGRSGATKGSSGPSVITVSSGGATGTAASGTEATFTSDWPAGTKGFTVQLQTLPSAGTTVAAVQAAKAAASAKGATAVGALKSEEFASLPAGNYVIYSGTYHNRGEAQKALASLKKNFPSASVIEVSSGSAHSASSSAAEHEEVPQAGGTGQSINHPAPPSVLNGLHNAKGKSYVEKSKNLPNVVETP